MTDLDLKNMIVEPSCNGCGVCCLAIGHPHFWRHDGDPHWVRLPEELKAELIDYIDGLEEADIGQPCVWFVPETRLCRHYEYRPAMCRDFAAGSVHCLRMRAAHGVAD
jgi:Fe-S-cluster containining protein